MRSDFSRGWKSTMSRFGEDRYRIVPRSLEPVSAFRMFLLTVEAGLLATFLVNFSAIISGSLTGFLFGGWIFILAGFALFVFSALMTFLSFPALLSFRRVASEPSTLPERGGQPCLLDRNFCRPVLFLCFRSRNAACKEYDGCLGHSGVPGSWCPDRLVLVANPFREVFYQSGRTFIASP